MVRPNEPPQALGRPAGEPALRPGDSTFQAVFMTPEEVFDNLPKWGAIFKDIFR